MSTYKALLCERLASTVPDGIAALRIADLPRKSLRADQLRVEVHAAGVNFFDLLTLVGKYQMKPAMPFTPLSEGAGRVVEVGADCAAAWLVGERVCFNLWSPVDGGAAAEEVVVQASSCWRLPAALSWEEGAGFLVGYATAYHALVHRAALQPGETLLVTGAAGGMGLAALQLGKLLGAKLIAAGSDPRKLAAVGQLVGIPPSHLVSCARPADLKQRVSELTDGAMVDVVYENVGGDVFDACVRCMAPYGRLLVIGFASGRIPSLPANLALVKGFSLVGVRAGAQLVLESDKAAAMYHHLLRLAAEGRLRPVVSTAVPLARFAEAFGALAGRTVVGKAVICPRAPGAVAPAKL